MTRTGLSWRLAAAILATATLGAGCSDKSPMKLYIDSVTGVASTIAQGIQTGMDDKGFIEADMMGSNSAAPCTPVGADMANVKVRLMQPGTIGPTLNAFITSYQLDYFYFDPADGVLRGPVPRLGVYTSDLHLLLVSNSQTDFNIPAVPRRVKIWSVGVTCGGITGFGGPIRPNRMLARITLNGEDETGQKLTAQANVLIYLEDYPAFPTPPTAGAPLTNDNYCFGMTYPAYWSGYCP